MNWATIAVSITAPRPSRGLGGSLRPSPTWIGAREPPDRTLAGSSMRLWSVVVPAACHGPTDGPENPQDDTDDHQDRTERIEETDVQQRADDDQNDSKNNHQVTPIPASSWP